MSFTAEDAEIAEKNLEMSKTRKVPAKPLETGKNVIPGQPRRRPGRPGIQFFRWVLDSGFRRNDGGIGFCRNGMVM